jgi:ABC-type uncharacterized transport system substrate-binding protein
MRRRDFFGLIGGAAAWPVAARAQQGERMRRVGVHMNSPADSPEGKARFGAFMQGLDQLGWNDGRNVRIDVRWAAAGDVDRNRKTAAELIALAPDIILATTGPSATALQRATRTIPIVFAMVLDPVGADIVESLPWPGGHTTGFMQFEFSLAGKWLELLKQIAPGVKRAVVLRDATQPTGIAQLAAMQSVAPSLGVELSPVGVRDPDEIERHITAFARAANGGLIVTSGARTIRQRDQILALAARHRLPGVYPERIFVADGGLISYGTDTTDQYRRAAQYVGRILKGEKPADLPVQQPTKFDIVINLKTAKALGLIVPPTLLARADEVIE